MKKRCAHPICETAVQARGLCARHGAKGTCSYSGCETNAAAWGRCRKHAKISARAKCSLRGCAALTSSETKGFCKKHNGQSICSTLLCTNEAVDQKLCSKHLEEHVKIAICLSPGCTCPAMNRGLCKKHIIKSTCSVSKCKASVQAWGLCFKHGAKGICGRDGCTALAYACGLCVSHRRRGRAASTNLDTSCFAPGCDSLSGPNGVCCRHVNLALH